MDSLTSRENFPLHAGRLLKGRWQLACTDRRAHGPRPRRPTSADGPVARRPHASIYPQD